MDKKKGSTFQNIKGMLMLFFIFFMVPFLITLAIRMVGESEKTKPMIVINKSWRLSYYDKQRTCDRSGCSDSLRHLSTFSGTYPSKPLLCGNAEIERKIKKKYRIKSYDSCRSAFHLELSEPKSNEKYKYKITHTEYFDESVYPLQSKLQVAYNNFGKVLYVHPLIR